MADQRRLAVVTAAIGLAVTACGGPEAAESSSPRPTSASDATAAPTTSDRTAPAGPGPTGQPSPVAIDLGDPLDPDAFTPRGAGIAWQLPGSVLLTSTSGTPFGHLPGWSLDREASDRLATAVLQSPSGPVAVTAGGLVATTEPLPVADGGTLVVEDGAATVRTRTGDPAATLALAAPDLPWVSATGSVVGVVDGDHWDVEAGAPVEVAPGCRVADRHEPDDPLLVCDDGRRLDGGTDVPAPQGARFGWVTVGTTGDEVLATLSSGDGPGVAVGSRVAGTLEVIHEPGADTGGVGLFHRSNGSAWIAALGPGGGLDLLTESGATERVRDLRGVTDAAMWTR